MLYCRTSEYPKAFILIIETSSDMKHILSHWQLVVENKESLIALKYHLP